MRRKPVVPRVAAATDINQIIEYYLEEAPGGVARRFIDALEKTFEGISRHPASGSPRYSQELELPGLRCMQVTGFPYLVFYVEQPELVDVWRVLHSTRDAAPAPKAPAE